MVENPVTPGSFIECTVDAARVNEVIGLPNGLSLVTDVSASATQQSPYGSWLNTGSVQAGFDPTAGCISIFGNPSDWATATTGGANNDGVYDVQLTIDMRIASTNPDISFLIPNGTWISDLSSLGLAAMPYDLELRTAESGCGGSLFAFPEVTSDNDQTPNCDGEVTVEVYNGTPPYTYSFSTGTTGTPTDTALCAGQYSVSIEDAVGNTTTTSFIVGSSANVFTNVGNNGWPPVGTDSLFSLYYTCDLDYSLPIDSFYITGALTVGTDTCLVDWVIWQAGQPYSATTIYPFLGLNPTVFSLILWCENGRAELGSFQIYEFLDLSVGVGEELSEIRFTVSPNPSDGQFTVQLQDGAGFLEVFDLNGHLVKREPIATSLIELDMESFPSGMYLLKVHNEMGVGYRRLIKQ